MVKFAGVLSGLVVAGWIYLMGDVQHNFIEDPEPRIAYEAGTFYAVALLVLIWLTVLLVRR
jgi:hypothetical protein